jgi:hypothetical protein
VRASLRARGVGLAFALLPVAQWISSFRAAATIRTVGTHDTAYYYVLARNFALGRGLTDTVLWQFLGLPEAVARPAGGYWEVGWPLVLGSLMRVFGTSQRAAILLCATLSALLPVLTAWVAWLATRRAGVAWLSGALVVAQLRLLRTDISPDATLFYELACLGGLAAFFLVREGRLSPLRLALAGAALAVPMYVRGEGFLVAATALPLLLLGGGARLRERARRLGYVAAGLAALVLPFTLRNLAVFGRALPAGRALRLWMTSYGELYAFRGDPSPGVWWAQGRDRLLAVRVQALETHLDRLTHQVPWPLLALAALGLLAHARAARGRAAALPLFVGLSLLVPCLTVPLIASFDRFVPNVLPVLCVLAAAGAFAVRDGVRWVVPLRAEDAPVPFRVLDALVVGGALWAATMVFRPPRTIKADLDVLRVYRDTPASMADGKVVGPLGLRPDDVVLTDEPWRVAAVLDVATVMCPMDGPSAVDALVERYRPRFVLAAPGSALAGLVSRKRFPLRAVGTAKEATWYELEPPVRRADGRSSPP